MVFRRDSKVDAFQRQISALRSQLGNEPVELPAFASESERPPVAPAPRPLPDLDFFADTTYTLRDELDLPSSAAPLAEAAAPPALPQSPLPALDTETSVIAHGTTWSGNLESTGSLHVHGRVDGSLTARNSIFIAEDAEIDATLTAAHVVVAGLVRGSVRCLERFEVLPRGRVSGDVRAPRIVVHDGAVVSGDLAMSSDAAMSHSAPSRAVRNG